MDQETRTLTAEVVHPLVHEEALQVETVVLRTCMAHFIEKATEILSSTIVVVHESLFLSATMT